MNDDDLAVFFFELGINRQATEHISMFREIGADVPPEETVLQVTSELALRSLWEAGRDAE